jgi:hypothetical protein
MTLCAACHLLSRWFLSRLILRPWRWVRYVTRKRRLTFNRLYGVISQKVVSALHMHRCENLRSCRWILSSSLHPVSLMCIFILIIFHLCRGYPGCLFRSDSSIEMLYPPLTSSVGSPCHTHLILLDLMTLMTVGDEYMLWSSSLCSFLRCLVASSLLDPNIPSAPSC